MRLDFSIPFYFGLRVVLLLCVGLPSVALAQNEDFARKRCVDVGFPAGTAGHADCVKQYLESAGRGKPAAPKPTPTENRPPPDKAKIEADIAIEKQMKKEALERDRQIELEKKAAQEREYTKRQLEQKSKEVEARIREEAKRKEEKKANALAVEFKDCGECPEMVVIPAGQFTMGASQGEVDSENLPKEFRDRSQPQHRVEVKRFAAGKFSVTRAQYEVFVSATGRKSDGCYVSTGSKWENDSAKDWRNPGFAQDQRHPVACVSWDDAIAYVQWLSQKTGKSYRLLSEAEWEYAARAETTTYRYWGDDGNLSCSYANGADQISKAQVQGASNWAVTTCNDGYAYTSPVGIFQSNRFGLYDMLGNVWQWTQDCWIGNYKGAPTDGSAWTGDFEIGNCAQRVLRGGSWMSNPQDLRSASRYWGKSVYGFYSSGFRVAMSIETTADGVMLLAPIEAMQLEEGTNRKDEQAKRKEEESKRLLEEKKETEQRRQEQIKKLKGLGEASTGPTDKASAAKASAPSGAFLGRLRARVRPNITFAESQLQTVKGNPEAEVEVTCSRTGEITSKKLTRSSGNPAWDAAVMNAIEKTGTLPLDENGNVPPKITFGFRPRD